MVLVEEHAVDPQLLDDGVHAAMLARNAARMPKLIELGRPATGGVVAEQYLDALATAVYALPDDRVAMVADDPLYTHWASKINTEPDARWILELGRLTLFAHLQAGTLPEDGIYLPLSGEAEIRVPQLTPFKVPGQRPRSITRIAVNQEQLVAGSSTAAVLGGVSQLVEQGRTSHRRVHDILIDSADPWVTDFLTAMNEAPRVGPYPERDLVPVRNLSHDLKSTYAEALDLLGDVWPEAFAEVCRYVNLIVPFRSEYLFGWSTPTFQGAAFLRAAPGDVLFTFERIVHEAAHQRLFAIQRFARIHTDPPGKKLPSALRRDQRPTSGVYHAAFVCGRLVQAFGRAGAKPLGSDWESRFEQVAKAYFDMSETLHAHASLTQTGHHMLAALDARVRASI